MAETNNSGTSRTRSQIVWVAGLLFVCGLAGVLVTWRMPGLQLYVQKWLIRARGPLPVPEDIAIVAIDEMSLTRLGRFPWRRALTAQLLEQLGQTHPKAIALDVLFSEATMRMIRRWRPQSRGQVTWSLRRSSARNREAWPGSNRLLQLGELLQESATCMFPPKLTGLQGRSWYVKQMTSAKPSGPWLLRPYVSAKVRIPSPYKSCQARSGSAVEPFP
jgi:hypothetical protein